MITNTAAAQRWCPFAMAQGDIKDCQIAGQWVDSTITGVRSRYNIDGSLISRAAANRLVGGDPHPDCLCITDKCQWWRKDLGTGAGACSKFDDNWHDQTIVVDDAAMKSRWCPMARPDGSITEGSINGTISGCSAVVISINRAPGGQPLDGAKCITTQCMAYASMGSQGACMAGDRNMQRG